MKWGILCCLCASLSWAAPPIFPLEKVRRGQVGYGYTTFKGNQPEKFPFEVVSVANDFIPGLPIIMVKSDDPRFAISGFWQGMSGSPLYIEDQVACAFSYGFRFNKVALGGCTPLAAMMEEGFGKTRRGPSPTRGRALPLAQWRQLTPAERQPQSVADWLAATKPRPLAAPIHEGATMRASVPLAVAGLSERGFADLAQALNGTGLDPIRTGISHTSGPFAAPDKLVMGGSIGVVMARGDVSISGTGTVSYIDGKRVLAFGHPMFSEGELYLPVTTAHVHMVIPSAQMSYVMASPGKEVGSLVQDRQSTIMADLSLRAPMIPVQIDLAMRGEPTHTLRAEVAANKWLTSQMILSVARSAIDRFAPDRDIASARITGDIAIKGHGTLTVVDAGFDAEGIANALGAMRSLRMISPLLQNPFAPLEIERVHLRIEGGYDIRLAMIKGLELEAPQLVPGRRNYVQVRLETYDGEPRYERVPVDVPMSLAGTVVQLELASGDVAKSDAPMADDIGSMLRVFRSMLPATSFVATIYPPGEGVSVAGNVLLDVPGSAADRLRPITRVQRAQPYAPMLRTVTPTDASLQGTISKLVRIGNKP